MAKVSSHLPELGDLINASSKEEFKKKLVDLLENNKTRFFEELPSFMGYGTSRSGAMFTELYLDGEQVCLAQGNIEDYERLSAHPDKISKEAFYERAESILLGMDKLQTFSDKEGAIEAYKERLENRTQAEKDGLLDTLYKGTKEVRFYQFSKDELISAEYVVDSNIVKYLKKQTVEQIQTIRKELLDGGYNLTPQSAEEMLGELKLNFKILSNEEPKPVKDTSDSKVGDMFANLKQSLNED